MMNKITFYTFLLLIGFSACKEDEGSSDPNVFLYGTWKAAETFENRDIDTDTIISTSSTPNPVWIVEFNKNKTGNLTNILLEHTASTEWVLHNNEISISYYHQGEKKEGEFDFSIILNSDEQMKWQRESTGSVYIGETGENIPARIIETWVLDKEG